MGARRSHARARPCRCIVRGEGFNERLAGGVTGPSRFRHLSTSEESWGSACHAI
ncbi:hypothetical protein AKJ09_05386 [Labilithrix luteola]|uniref:Uncharacterized protein n=1 Tax=Labilithrix luteola TaxID=1391654 RepID=A0A0K1PZ13_9BACT|nr:hypothetical protein AKJ09_05386 [Labilithrix luteola]